MVWMAWWRRRFSVAFCVVTLHNRCIRAKAVVLSKSALGSLSDIFALALRRMCCYIRDTPWSYTSLPRTSWASWYTIEYSPSSCRLLTCPNRLWLPSRVALVPRSGQASRYRMHLRRAPSLSARYFRTLRTAMRYLSLITLCVRTLSRLTARARRACAA